MTNKRVRLPKDGLEPGGSEPREPFIDSDDVEGHGLPTTAPPSVGLGGRGHGGENIPSPVDDDDPTGTTS